MTSRDSKSTLRVRSTANGWFVIEASTERGPFLDEATALQIAVALAKVLKDDGATPVINVEGRSRYILAELQKDGYAA